MNENSNLCVMQIIFNNMRNHYLKSEFGIVIANYESRNGSIECV